MVRGFFSRRHADVHQTKRSATQLILQRKGRLRRPQATARFAVNLAPPRYKTHGRNRTLRASPPRLSSMAKLEMQVSNCARSVVPALLLLPMVPGDVGHEPLGTACSPAGTAAKELWSAPAEASGETASFSNLSDTRTATTSGRAGSKKFLITDVTNTPAGNSVSPAGRAVSSGPDAPAAVLSQITPKGETPAGKRFAIRDVGQAEPVRREDSAGGVSSRPAAPLCGKRGLGGVFPEPAPRPSAGSRRASESDACVLGLEHRTTSPALSAKEWDERLLGADAGKMDKAELVDAVLAMQQRLKALTHETAELQRETDAIRAKIGTMQ